MEDVAARRAWLPAAGFALLILAVSSIPASQMPQSELLWSFDKLIHAAEYATFGALVSRTLWHHWPTRPTLVLILAAALVCAAFGALDEFYQGFTGRSSDPRDWLADAFGATAGAVVAAMWYRTRRSNPWP